MKFLLPLAVITGLGGCASVPLPPEAAAVTLVYVPSAAVALYPVVFKNSNGAFRG